MAKATRKYNGKGKGMKKGMKTATSFFKGVVNGIQEDANYKVGVQSMKTFGVGKATASKIKAFRTKYKKWHFVDRAFELAVLKELIDNERMEKGLKAITQSALAVIIGKNQGYISHLLMIASLPYEILDWALADSELNYPDLYSFHRSLIPMQLLKKCSTLGKMTGLQ